MRRHFAIFTFAVITGLLNACFEADPRSVRGALDQAARAVEQGDARELFKVIDARSRHALISIVADRKRAVRTIAADYPPEARAAALGRLGDAAEAKDAADLFARRCREACLGALAQTLAAPVSERRLAARVLEVETARGGRLQLRKGDSWWGLVWRERELSDERDLASRELRQIKENAAIHRRRRQLEASLRPSGGGSWPGADAPAGP
ncbi:MAG: hypothetical protein OEZ06_26050 [Myxococcales bacterium]|nr:hypothetical protein [Myxococcales bacterium]